jgi:serine/threonine-protein kinase
LNFIQRSDESLPRPFGKYTLLSRIATGGMANVFLALQRGEFGLEKLVVVKCLLPALVEESRFIEMFLDEARIAATLTHPNIVQIFDAGEVEGTYFIAMEYVEGQDLRRLSRVRRERGEPALPLDHAIYIVTQALSGLDYAHKKSDFSGSPLDLVHRDISPQNLLLAFSGNVKVVDFGVAKSAMHLSEQSSAGQLKGKIAYMSPEQARGMPVDARTDLFALTIVLYELTTGVRLFRGSSDVETLQRVYSAEYASPRSVRPAYPEVLEAIVARGLCKDRRQRYQTARQMQVDLMRFAESAALNLSEARFADWLKSELSDIYKQQKQLMTQVRELATRAGERPSQPSRAPASRPPRALRYPGATDTQDENAVSSTPATLRGSAHTVAPYNVRRSRRRWLVSAALLAIVAGVVVIAGGWIPLPGTDTAQLKRSRSAATGALGKQVAALWRDVRGLTKQDASDMATLDFDITPANAAVWLDGSLVTDGKASVSRDEIHELRVSAPGYTDRAFQFRPTEKRQRVKVELETKEQ